jgi:predicted membrane-bound spermidine synthase
MGTKKTWPVLLLFFCSGATALVYEVVWSKYLSQMLGSTIYAQTVVLAVFMGGLALGNRWFGAKADALKAPVRVYGFVELAIGLYAFFFPNIYAAADRVFVSAGSSVLENTAALMALKGSLSLLLLIGPTILMGGTLPLLVVFLQRTSLDAGRRSARFYSVNSLGAVFGSAVAGFYLIQNWGMVASLQLAALVNLIIAGAAILLSRSLETSPAPVAVAQAEAPVLDGKPLRWATLLVALTGGISMGLEVLASRSMALLFGSSLQSFAIVLISFILGIGLGSAAIASPRFRAFQSTKAITVLLMAAALWIGLLVFRIESWVDVYRYLSSGLGRSSMGYIFHQLLAAGIAMFVLGIPAALIGGVLPLLIRAGSNGSAMGKQVGRLLTWNTIGAVGGVLLTGFVLMPQLGLRNAFLFLALGLAVAAVIASYRANAQPLVMSAGFTSMLLFTFMCVGNDSWRNVMSSGVFRARETEVSADALTLRKKHTKTHFYEDAPDATVSIEQGDGIGAPADVGLRINGKTDASSRYDMSTQLLIGHIPLAANPDAKEVFILGLGSGVTGGAILGHPVDHLTIAENCEPIVRAARYFAPWNRGVLTNPLTRIVCEDARTLLKLSPKKYDVIITQPSNPWMAGVGSVFSQEYYELGKSRLNEGGIMAQWFHVYDMHDGIVALVLRTFASVFPHMEIWDSGSGDLILLGGTKPWQSNPDVYQRLFAREAVKKDFESIGIQSPQALWARQLASQETAFAIPGAGPIQTDLFPVLEYEAPRAFYIGAVARDMAKFDERTWQLELAPPEKRQTLAALDDKTLQPIFSAFSTINEELRGHLNWRFKNGVGCSPEFRPTWPCVFRHKENVPAPDATGLDDEVKKVLAAAAQIEKGGPGQTTGVDAMISLLRAYGPSSDWSPTHYGGLAAKASIAARDFRRAEEALAAALQLNSQSTELNFLHRVVERKRTMLAASNQWQMQ